MRQPEGFTMTAPGRREDPLVNLLGSLDGARFPGGCDSCNAYQTVCSEAPGVWLLDIFHDDECPFFKAEGGQ
jgi:hypothetical protein